MAQIAVRNLQESQAALSLNTYEFILEIEAGLFRLVPVVVLGDRVQPEERCIWQI